jgi:beta-lactamase regulating signal transducer with metallopeptidase domain
MTYSVSQTAVAVSESLMLLLTVKATIVTGLALIVTRIASGARASIRHLLWTGVFAILLALPFGALIAPSIQIQVAGNQQAEQALPVIHVPATVAATVINAAAPESQDNATQSIPISIALAAIWIAGAIVFAAPMAAGLWQLHRIRRFSLPWLQGKAILRDLARSAGIKKDVDLVLHNGVAGPITCGIFRPTIICPLDAQSWSRADLQRALIHELEHAVRGDCLTHGLARFVCAIYWFHPLVWTSWRRLSLEAERACDDAVLRRAEAADYADQLLTLAQRMNSGA